MIPYKIAIEFTKIIQGLNPDYVPCGSLALMVAGLLPKGEVHDLDFASPKFVKAPSTNIRQTSRAIRNQQAPYICYGFEYKVDCMSFHYDVFYYPECEDGITVDGIKMQSLEQILHWKRRFNRPKDQEMLSKIDNALDDLILDL